MLSRPSTSAAKGIWARFCVPRGREYHDQSFGFRKPREFTLPDYTRAQLANRAENASLLRYVDSIRTHGHRAARIDPLDLLQRDEVAALDPTRYGLTDVSRRYNINGIVWSSPFGTHTSQTEKWWSLREITEHLRSTYVGRIAYEFMHSPSKIERLWFSHLLESQTRTTSNDEKRRKRRIHELLARSETFDKFLQLKFPNLKRYGLEGGESMLPALDTLFFLSSEAGIRHIILAMPHRGRLNLLTGLLRYSPSALFHKIKGGAEFAEELGAEGDVISHLAASPTLLYEGVRDAIKVSLLPNPSHLEAVNSVAMGKTRAKQYSFLKTSAVDCKLGDKVMCVQLHGDASFTGQGVVMESLGLSNLPHFTSGGSIHLVVNNSIGYTTPASHARSSLYCSDVGKMINAPVLHVNGDYPEDVARAIETAFKYRNHFRKDIIVDLLVYRRWGHNELDEPSFTQPLMYQNIRSRDSVPQLYENKLLSEGLLTAEDAMAIRAAHKAHLETELAITSTYLPPTRTLDDQWSQMVWPASDRAIRNPDTGLDRKTLTLVGRASVAVPEGFEIHPRLQRHVKPRLQSLATGEGIDWATAEAMAFGSLMLEGQDVRISGQDVGRGTFSQRHAMLVDQRTERVTVPLNAELKSEGRLELANSSLSEMGVLGFEYGVSWERPNILPIWEAQFGDFFNGAQIIIDTFISSSETKWLRQSGIVLLLPHGLDGTGPDHSSCRLERMLQLSDAPFAFEERGSSANVNMHITFPTTPAQYFHLLRRQLKRNFRKPLIVAGPKGLLRLATAISSLTEFEPGTRFKPILVDPFIDDPNQVRRVVFLSGKIYYELVKNRASRNVVAFVRIEELSPFPFGEVREALKLYANAQEFVWLQEEPRNQGAWMHVERRIDAVLMNLGLDNRVRYTGRAESGVSATGIVRRYIGQQKAIIEAAFEGL